MQAARHRGRPPGWGVKGWKGLVARERHFPLEECGEGRHIPLFGLHETEEVQGCRGMQWHGMHGVWRVQPGRGARDERLAVLPSAQAAISCQHTPQNERKSRAAPTNREVASGADIRAQAAHLRPARQCLHAGSKREPGAGSAPRHEQHPGGSGAYERLFCRGHYFCSCGASPGTCRSVCLPADKRPLGQHVGQPLGGQRERVAKAEQEPEQGLLAQGQPVAGSAGAAMRWRAQGGCCAGRGGGGSKRHDACVTGCGGTACCAR